MFHRFGTNGEEKIFCSVVETTSGCRGGEKCERRRKKRGKKAGKGGEKRRIVREKD